MIWGQGILLGFGPCFWALVFRKQAFTFLQSHFESKQRLNDGAFIVRHSLPNMSLMLPRNDIAEIVYPCCYKATLLEAEDMAPAELMNKSTALLRRIPFSNLSEELLSTSGGSAETYALSEPCPVSCHRASKFPPQPTCTYLA